MRNIKTAARSLAIIAAVLVSAAGVSYAALQSQPIKLTGNTIETATANLQVSTDGTDFATSLPGFDFANLVPGGAAVPAGGYSFTLKNGGAISLNLKLAVSSTPSNPANVDLSKVNVILTPVGSAPQSFSLQALMTANAGGGVALSAPAQLFAGTRQLFTVQVLMAVDALSGSSASLGNIDFAFTGVAVTS
jgi:hypothetical protein